MRRRTFGQPSHAHLLRLHPAVLEAQYQSALTAAVKAINASNKTVCFEVVGYLLEELRDNNNFAAFQADMQDANIFIGSLIFIEELAEKVRTASCGLAPVWASVFCGRYRVYAVLRFLLLRLSEVGP